ncbi:hypothetical protein RI685_16320 (plasmid) [Clavibacter michiganensis]|uniref:hypothetical protein n=1 Tax=Clavibacter michiganensis TaxID=28447 RepID=UPI003DA12857
MVRDACGRLDGNSYPRLHPLGAAAPSTPWAIRLADPVGRYRFLCFDFDGKDSTGVVPELLEQAQDQAAVLSRTLDELAIAHVLCRSSGAGGRHVWIAVDGGADAARPLLSPHRDGGASTVLAGDVRALLASSTMPVDLNALAALVVERMPAPQAVDRVPSGPVDGRHRAHRRFSRWRAAPMATLAGWMGGHVEHAAHADVRAKASGRCRDVHAS